MIKNPKVGMLVEVPYYCFAPYRTGWNGWIFRVGIVDRVYKNKAGENCATVTFAVEKEKRYQLLPIKEATKNFHCSELFRYKFLELSQHDYTMFKEKEDAGEQICWDVGTGFLLKHGFIK